jgi:RNA polymerase sigma factor FliA
LPQASYRFPQAKRPGRLLSFERHAATRIRGALLDELRDSDWASRCSRRRGADRAAEPRPDPAELAVELGTDPQAVHKLVDRERRAYLADAVLALPERLRAVVIGHFYEERPMPELAAELGVTESRVSQLRAEALILLRDGLNAHLDPDTLPAEPRPEGRLAKRRAACSDFRARLDAAPRPLLERAAEAGAPAPAPA